MKLVIASIAVLMLALPLHADTVSVSAAISLKESLAEIRKSYEKTSSDTVVFNFDASGKLAAQIQQGAPVDLFISADNMQMNKLAEQIDAKSRRIIVDNTLVLITSAQETNPPGSFADLANDRGKKIAVGEPKTVPAGQYAMQTLRSLKLDQAVAPRLVYGESVRQVLTFVEKDQVCAGIVYGTDAQQAGDKVKVIAKADASTHDPIEYPAAVIQGSAHADAARRFLDYLTSEPAKRLFTSKGFTFPDSKIAGQKP